MEEKKKKNKIVVWIAIISTLLITLYACQDKRVMKISRHATRALALQDVVGTYYVRYIPGWVVEFLKKQDIFADHFYADKQLVIYTPDTGCPYRAKVVSAINQFRKNNPEVAEKYNFVQLSENVIANFRVGSKKDIEAVDAFFTECATFCVINPRLEQVFSYASKTYFEDMAANVEVLLPQLVHWGEE